MDRDLVFITQFARRWTGTFCLDGSISEHISEDYSPPMAGMTCSLRKHIVGYRQNDPASLYIRMSGIQADTTSIPVSVHPDSFHVLAGVTLTLTR